uniref:Uncharacterized protein n=1 Tax=Arundo donax TaxID=35708 RepID=A0A0A9CKX5_ARUDO
MTLSTSLSPFMFVAILVTSASGREEEKCS